MCRWKINNWVKVSIAFQISQRVNNISKIVQLDNNVRSHDIFKVNFAKTNSYKNSTIPYCQKLVNTPIINLPLTTNKLNILNDNNLY